MVSITSPQNPALKKLKLLKTKKGREELKQFFIEGTRFVEEAIKQEINIIEIFVSESFIEKLNIEDTYGLMIYIRKHSKVFVLSDKLFSDISDTQTPQGILAILNYNRSTISDIAEENNRLVILDTLQDPGNMGTIIRTADAAGFTGIVICEGCVDLYNPKVLRATMGSLFHVPIYLGTDAKETIEEIKQKGLYIYAAHLEGEKNYFELTLIDNFAIVIGNEANGIDSFTAAATNELVKIPMPGKAESLNAAVAAALFMYESVRQRMK